MMCVIRTVGTGSKAEVGEYAVGGARAMGAIVYKKCINLQSRTYFIFIMWNIPSTIIKITILFFEARRKCFHEYCI